MTLLLVLLASSRLPDYLIASPVGGVQISSPTRSHGGRGSGGERFAILGSPKAGGLIGVIGLFLALAGVIIAFLSFRGDEIGRAFDAKAATPEEAAGASEEAAKTNSGPADVTDASSEGPQPQGSPYIEDGDTQIYRFFDLPIRGGHAYDIDVDPGRTPVINGGRESSTDDLYRSGNETELTTWQLYVPQAPRRGIKQGVFQVMDDRATPSDCLKLGAKTTGSDSFDAALVSVGAKACVKTGEGRWVMINVLSLPRQSDSFLRVRVTLLKH